MKDSLLDSLGIGERAKSIASYCKQVIYSQFSYFHDRKAIDIEPIDYDELNEHIQNGDEEQIDQYVEIALANCFNEIEDAVEKLTNPKMQKIINGSQIIALFSIYMTIALKSQDVSSMRIDLKKERLSTKNEDEAYHSLVLGTLETIYALAMKKEEKPLDIIKNRVLN